MFTITKKSIRKYTSIALCIIIFLTLTSPYAAANNLTNVNFSAMNRGNSIPTTEWSLGTNGPYTGYATLTTYVYTDYYFRTDSAGRLRTYFTGDINTGTSTVTIYVVNCNTGVREQSKVINPYPGSTWTNVSMLWTGLNTYSNYCFEIRKTNSNSLTCWFTVQRP